MCFCSLRALFCWEDNFCQFIFEHMLGFLACTSTICCVLSKSELAPSVNIFYNCTNSEMFVRTFTCKPNSI